MQSSRLKWLVYIAFYCLFLNEIILDNGMAQLQFVQSAYSSCLWFKTIKKRNHFRRPQMKYGKAHISGLISC